MKHARGILICVLLLSGGWCFGQCMEAEYKIAVEGGDAPIYVDMSKLDIRLKVYSIPDHTVLETRLAENSNTFKSNDDTKFTYIDKKELKIFQFSSDSLFIGAFSLKTDTLVASHKAAQNGYECMVYLVKNHENIKVYASPALDGLINPGINYYGKNIGGIVAIEITLDKRKVRYTLISHRKGDESGMLRLQQLSASQKTGALLAKSILQY